MSSVAHRSLHRVRFKPARAAAVALGLLILSAEAAHAQGADEACRQTLAQTVEFASDRTTLDATARALVRRQAKCLEGRAGAITVEGFWDDSATQPKARELSLRLASRVREELVKSGIAEGRVKTVGHGREQSLDPERPTERRRAVRLMLGSGA
jgi:outer membrane protein OmpA-like peptidoglycan-associated protein